MPSRIIDAGSGTAVTLMLLTSKSSINLGGWNPTSWSMVESELEPLAALYGAELKSRIVAALAVWGRATAIADKTNATTSFLIGS